MQSSMEHFQEVTNLPNLVIVDSHYDDATQQTISVQDKEIRKN
jgi:hypothetical protein